MSFSEGAIAVPLDGLKQPLRPEKHEMLAGEESVGLPLDADESDEHVKLLHLSDSCIRIASSLTEL